MKWGYLVVRNVLLFILMLLLEGCLPSGDSSTKSSDSHGNEHTSSITAPAEVPIDSNGCRLGVMADKQSEFPRVRIMIDSLVLNDNLVVPIPANTDVDLYRAMQEIEPLIQENYHSGDLDLSKLQVKVKGAAVYRRGGETPEGLYIKDHELRIFFTQPKEIHNGIKPSLSPICFASFLEEDSQHHVGVRTNEYVQ